MVTSIQQRLCPYLVNITSSGWHGHSAHYNLDTHIRTHAQPVFRGGVIGRGNG